MEGTWGLEGGRGWGLGVGARGGQGEYTLALKHVRTSHRYSSILVVQYLEFFFHCTKEKRLLILTPCDHDH